MKNLSKLKSFFLVGTVALLVFVTPLNAFAAYNGTKAANYAKNHATSYNSNYPSFSSDCTNFVSQCVHAGGISMDYIPTDSIKYSHIDDIFKTKSYWSTGKYTRTTTLAGITIYKKTGFVTTSTWSVVAKNDSDSFWGFYNYMKSKGASTKEYAIDTV